MSDALKEAILRAAAQREKQEQINLITKEQQETHKALQEEKYKLLKDMDSKVHAARVAKNAMFGERKYVVSGEGEGHVLVDTELSQALRQLMYRKSWRRKEFIAEHESINAKTLWTYENLLFKTERKPVEIKAGPRKGQNKSSRFLVWCGPSIAEIVAAIPEDEWSEKFEFWERQLGQGGEAELWFELMIETQKIRESL